jgi:hypothetical protein
MVTTVVNSVTKTKNIAIRKTEDGTRLAMEISVVQRPDGTSSFSFDAETERLLPLTLSDARNWIEGFGDSIPEAFKEPLLQQLISTDDSIGTQS